MHEPAGEIDDEVFLEALFDRAVDLLSDGREPSLDELLEGRDRLRSRVGELLQLAREVCVRAVEPFPHVPGYQIERELGRGGMGSVYLARQVRVGGRRVALKVLPQLASASSRARERFAGEIRALSKLSHRNVIAIHDVVLEREVCAYAMECVDGGSLADVIRAGEAAGDRVVFFCGVARTIARALHAAHEAGIVHRDVKPSNVLIARDGTPLLSDFGLARDDESGAETKTGAFVGTPSYSSPEQLRGDSRAVDARSDVYALGATLYHALAGRLPYEGRSTTELLTAIERGRLVPLRRRNSKLPRELDTIVAKAMESDPSRRYASAAEFADDIERLLNLQPIRARPASVLARVTKLVRRNRATAWGVVAGSVASLALAAALVMHSFFVPRWVDEHVREARIALLDPAFANILFISQHWSADLGEPEPFVARDGLTQALASYDAALRWAPLDDGLREERDVIALVADAADVRVNTFGARALGLKAYLEGRIDDALEAWTECERVRDPRRSPDPLLEAGLGLLHLVRDRPQLAYPRLREATQVFPDTGFLVTYLADAATQCGDFAIAEHALEHAGRMSQLDPQHALERVRADLCVATGRYAVAEKNYRSCGSNPIAILHFSRLLELQGRREEAIGHLAALPRQRYGSNFAAEVIERFDRWWAQLNSIERGRHIAAVRDLAPSDPRSLIARCRTYMWLASAPAERPMPATTAAAVPAFVNPSAWFSSPRLESLGLPELAEILEVNEMSRWSAIPSYPQSLKSLQALAWRSPWPGAMSRAVSALAGDFERRAARASSLFGAFAATCAVASAQNCPNAPCFQGLGDLPGGANYSHANCISGDGVHVGGASTAASSNGPQSYEPFVWDATNGMTYIGDLAGDSNSGDVYSLSNDGSVAVGWSASANCTATPWFSISLSEAFRWTAAGGMTALGDIAGAFFWSAARSVSDDGTTIVGITSTNSPQGNTHYSSLWTSSPGWLIHGNIDTFQSLYSGLSRNGQWAIGRHITNNFGDTQSIRWSASTGYQAILALPHQGGGSGYFPLAVSDDGIVVGADYVLTGQAFMWSDSGGYLLLGDLPGGASSSAANAITRDGELIAGFGNTAAGQEAALWDDGCAIYRLHDVLVAAGVAIPSGWVLKDCTGIVVNGNVISVCGTGTNPANETEAWVARFERPWMGANAYCTAGTTTNGCNASMSASGIPSIAATSGFTLSCSNVEGLKQGLIFYGVSGPKASVWSPGSSSFLCVKSPVQRTPPDSSGGTAGACDGAFSVDFLAFLATHPTALGQPFSAGDCVHAQAWFRDPPAPGTTNLSNGLQFTTMP